MTEPETQNPSPEEGTPTRGLLPRIFGSLLTRSSKKVPAQDQTLELPVPSQSASAPETLEQKVSGEAPVPAPTQPAEQPVSIYEGLGEYKEHLEFLTGKFRRIHTLENENAKLSKDYSDVLAKLKKVEDEISASKDKYETLHVQYVKKESEAEALHQRLGSQEWDLKTAREEKEEFLKSQKAYQDQINTHKNKIGEYEHIAAGLEAIITEMKGEYAAKALALGTALEGKEEQLSKYSAAILELQSQKADYVNQLAEQKIAYATLEARHKKAEERNRQVADLLSKQE